MNTARHLSVVRRPVPTRPAPPENMERTAHDTPPLLAALVVTDDRATGRFLARMLECFGFAAVVQVQTPVEAVFHFLRSRHDLVLMSAGMSRVDTLELACWIKEKSKRTPVLLAGGTEIEAGILKQDGVIDWWIDNPHDLLELTQAMTVIESSVLRIA